MNAHEHGKFWRKRVNIHSIVVFTNNRISVHNEDRELKTCFLEQLLYNICNMDREFFYEPGELEEIKGLLEAARCKESYPFDFDINEFKRDLYMANMDFKRRKILQWSI